VDVFLKHGVVSNAMLYCKPKLPTQKCWLYATVIQSVGSLGQAIWCNSWPPCVEQIAIYLLVFTSKSWSTRFFLPVDNQSTVDWWKSKRNFHVIWKVASTCQSSFYAAQCY